MKPTTIERHKKVRAEFNKLAGTMPVMHLYARLGNQFGYTEETIRKILAKKPP